MSSQSTVVQASTEQKKDTKFNFTDEWGTPQPVEDELLPVMTFDENFLPAAIRPWVRDVAERMSLPLDFTGPCALVTIAGVIGRRAFVYPKAFDKTWKEAIALSGLIIAPSGSKKTPCWKTFVNPVFEVDIKDGDKVEKVQLTYGGAGHVMGTYRMGKDPKTSVVDSFQRSHDHANLYLVGSGTFPTVGTANPTITLSALALRTADSIVEDFKKM